VPGGNETILLVEDPEEVLDAIAALLRRLGYEVHTARHLEEALDVVAGVENLDLLVTDVVLPAQNGLAVAERIRELRPGVAILYMSAFTSDLVIPAEDRSSGNFLSKPFTVEDIARKIRRILHPGEEEAR
jgi:CheY-like chemotaxis protein